MRHEPRIHAYAERRRVEGRTTGEIVRCLKRYIVREVFNVLPRTVLTSRTRLARADGDDPVSG
jgi:hypothetical protein